MKKGAFWSHQSDPKRADAFPHYSLIIWFLFFFLLSCCWLQIDVKLYELHNSDFSLLINPLHWSFNGRVPSFPSLFLIRFKYQNNKLITKIDSKIHRTFYLFKMFIKSNVNDFNSAMHPNVIYCNHWFLFRQIVYVLFSSIFISFLQYNSFSVHKINNL